MKGRLFYRMINFFRSGSNRSVIAVCFLMSTLFWFLIKFSKEYTHYIDYPISYVNQPSDKYMKDQPVSELKVKVRGYGFSFLKESFSNRDVAIDLTKLQKQGKGSTYFSLPQTLRPHMTRELNGFSILEVSPDTLFVNFSKKVKATLPIDVPLDLSFRENYIQYGDLKIEPNEIEVFGPDFILDTLSRIQTNVLSKEDISEDINVQLQVILPNDLVSSKTQEINVNLQVARFTEFNQVVPITIKNVPEGKELIIKPSKVDLSYWVAMKDAAKVKASDFVVYCDYNEIAMTERAVLNLFLDEDKKPSIVQRVKFHPSTIEFVIMN